MLMLHPWLTLVVFASFPFLACLAYWYSRKIGPLYQKLQEQSGRVHTTAQENIPGSGLSRLSPGRRGRRNCGENRMFYELSMKIARLSTFAHPSMDLLGTVSSMIALPPAVSWSSAEKSLWER